MKRFNLSDWAVRHPALVLFLILAIGVGGALSFLRLGRAEDPNFTIKVAIVTAHLAGRHRARDAGPGRRPDREEAPGAALLRQGRRPTPSPASRR